jgi:hypothetical protein
MTFRNIGLIVKHINETTKPTTTTLLRQIEAKPYGRNVLTGDVEPICINGEVVELRSHDNGATWFLKPQSIIDLRKKRSKQAQGCKLNANQLRWIEQLEEWDAADLICASIAGFDTE